MCIGCTCTKWRQLLAGFGLNPVVQCQAWYYIHGSKFVFCVSRRPTNVAVFHAPNFRFCMNRQNFELYICTSDHMLIAFILDWFSVSLYRGGTCLTWPFIKFRSLSHRTTDLLTFIVNIDCNRRWPCESLKFSKHVQNERLLLYGKTDAHARCLLNSPFNK